jgi:hypothetical protein
MSNLLLTEKYTKLGFQVATEFTDPTARDFSRYWFPYDDYDELLKHLYNKQNIIDEKVEKVIVVIPKYKKNDNEYSPPGNLLGAKFWLEMHDIYYPRGGIMDIVDGYESVQQIMEVNVLSMWFYDKNFIVDVKRGERILCMMMNNNYDGTLTFLRHKK